MADVKISELPALTTPSGGEELVVNASGTTKKITQVNLLKGINNTAANATAITIDSNQNVGIGTASPAQELDISSTNPAIRLTDTTTSGLHHELVSFGDDLRFAADVGNVQADTKIEFYIDNAQKMTIDSAGGITVSGGVYLGGTTSSNNLDDYEQSAFTPSARDAASGGNSQALSGTFKYTKIGRLVHFQIDAANIVTSGLTGTNRLYITGLPFTASYTSVCPVWHQNIDGPTSANVIARVIAGGSYVILDGMRNDTTDQTILVNDLTSGSSDIRLAGSYMTS
jgi:hypothetical protein|tara:strand:- start:1611 stop:2462 length:852 start_codon:yes stop_codon:yes gene_type:complete